MSAGKITGAADVAHDLSLTPDFCVVGSGAGGSMAAATLAAAGASVVMLEEGGHHTRREFNMQEAWAYPTLYQDHGNRATDDLAILVLQGRTVGGGTTVNWTSSFRTPEATLALWAQRHHVSGVDMATLEPHFDAVEQRLSIGPGNPDDMNTNNRKLWEGATKMGLQPELIRRSVKGCARLGYCGMGCPLDAKQSALVTYVPDAVAAGADVFANCKVVAVPAQADRVQSVIGEFLDEAADRPTGRRITVAPKRGVILAAGAINTPALLLRADLGRRRRLGHRTTLHPTVPIVGMFDQPIEGFYGAPQSVSVHRFADRGERVGYFIEAAPVHPMLSAVAFPGFGAAHTGLARRLPFAQATIALLIDGHHADEGGRVTLSSAGRTRLSYRLTPPLVEAAKDALRNMARLLLAAGAREIVTLHQSPLSIRSEAELGAIDAAPFGPNQHTLFSAHQMGGCAMGDDPDTAVVNSRGLHHDYRNLWIVDGSVFPTSLGVNPQLSIYALARLFASAIAQNG